MKILCKTLGCMLAAIFMASCTPMVTDSTVFALHYFGVSDMMPGETINLTPSYKGIPPTDFSIYSITHNGKIYYNPKREEPMIRCRIKAKPTLPSNRAKVAQ